MSATEEQPVTGREVGYANLRPITDTERAKELGRRSGEARRERRRRADELALRDLLPSSLKVLEKAQREYLAGDGRADPAIRAAVDVLNRELGMPTQKIEQTTTETLAVREMSDDELRARLAALADTPTEPQSLT